MKHFNRISTIHPIPQAAGLCDNIVGNDQAVLCFVLSLLRDVLVPLLQPFIQSKTNTNEGEQEE